MTKTVTDEELGIKFYVLDARKVRVARDLAMSSVVLICMCMSVILCARHLCHSQEG
jgi:hypothetical protein